ncbi:hypothetical protein HBB16_03635 [Pseudonocardia sp. MCCB 268]|nr:hypothetical protein [Pseudonocardia cytotoxica]
MTGIRRPGWPRCAGDVQGGLAYRTLSDAIRVLVGDGRLPSGTRLPTERALAAKLTDPARSPSLRRDLRRRLGRGRRTPGPGCGSRRARAGWTGCGRQAGAGGDRPRARRAGGPGRDNHPPGHRPARRRSSPVTATARSACPLREAHRRPVHRPGPPDRTGPDRRRGGRCTPSISRRRAGRDRVLVEHPTYPAALDLLADAGARPRWRWAPSRRRPRCRGQPGRRRRGRRTS